MGMGNVPMLRGPQTPQRDDTERKLYDARTFALVIAAIGLVNLALAVRPDRGAGA